MECTFRKKDILALFASDPDAKNMIVKVDKGGKKEFTGRMQKLGAKTDAAAMALTATDTEEIDGCPFPPGCNDGDE
ncbi:MAG: hypothetical protein ABIS69_09610 [Sediminibacterium sp.]